MDQEKMLRDCEQKIEQLEEENRHLRQASSTFGQLAERLTSTLDRERRIAASDRRHRPRHYPDRRQRTIEPSTQTAHDRM